MPTPTYTALATRTLTSTAASVTFSSIPATYRDLIVIYQGSTSAVAGVIARVNGDSGSNYTLVRMIGNSSGAISSAATDSYFPMVYSGNPQSALSILQIMDYSATDKHKSALTRTTHTSQSVVEALASRWANTAAITSIAISGGTFTVGSTFSLYGVIA